MKPSLTFDEAIKHVRAIAYAATDVSQAAGVEYYEISPLAAEQHLREVGKQSPVTLAGWLKDESPVFMAVHKHEPGKLTRREILDIALSHSDKLGIVTKESMLAVLEKRAKSIFTQPDWVIDQPTTDEAIASAPPEYRKIPKRAVFRGKCCISIE